MDRQIVCFAIPSLQIALARLSQPLLRTRPLAIATIDTPRALLREISTEAEQDGLHVGMTLDRARRLCPSLQVRPPNPRQVATANHSILGVIQRYAPTWGPVLPGSLLMDDLPRNVEKFRAHGGAAHLVPRPWNKPVAA